MIALPLRVFVLLSDAGRPDNMDGTLRAKRWTPLP